jgi:hypothetical protein
LQPKNGQIRHLLQKFNYSLRAETPYRALLIFY